MHVTCRIQVRLEKYSKTSWFIEVTVEHVHLLIYQGIYMLNSKERVFYGSRCTFLNEYKDLFHSLIRFYFHIKINDYMINSFPHYSIPLLFLRSCLLPWENALSWINVTGAPFENVFIIQKYLLLADLPPDLLRYINNLSSVCWVHILQISKFPCGEFERPSHNTDVNS